MYTPGDYLGTHSNQNATCGSQMGTRCTNLCGWEIRMGDEGILRVARILSRITGGAFFIPPMHGKQ